MFSIFRDKLQLVQDNLASSFRGLKLSEPTESVSQKLPIDLNAGAELLHKYQEEWQEMHIAAEDNAVAAQKVDVKISHLHGEVARQWEAATNLTAALATMPRLNVKIDEIIGQIGSVHSLIEAVETSLVQLADLVEQRGLQERQLEHRFQLALHSEQRLAQLDTLRVNLSDEHREKVTQFEKEFEKKQKERQDTFGKAFEEDLKNYKQTGTVPTIRPPLSSSLSLEEVELDQDQQALENMLEE